MAYHLSRVPLECMEGVELKIDDSIAHEKIIAIVKDTFLGF